MQNINFCWFNQLDVIHTVDQIYRSTHFGCFRNYGFAVLKVIFDCRPHHYFIPS